MRLPWIIGCALLLCRAAIAADEQPLLRYDRTKTRVYFDEKLRSLPPSSEPARKLAGLMKQQVLELAQKDWGPWVIHSQGHFRARAVYFNCTDELWVALAAAYPLLDAEGQAAALKAADRELAEYASGPVPQPWRRTKTDHPRYCCNGQDLPGFPIAGPGFWADGTRTALAGLKTFYGLWAYADAMGRWDAIKPLWPRLKQFRRQPAIAEWDFKPTWEKGQQPSVLTAEMASARAYLFETRRYFLWSTNVNHYSIPRDQPRIDFFQYNAPKLLSSLIGYGRIAARMGDADEAAWARERFDAVAQQALLYRSSPFYWSSPHLTPEVARLLRDHAAEFIAKVRGDNGNLLVMDESDGMPHAGPWMHLTDTQSWYVARVGLRGAHFPSNSMSGFLTQAYLYQAPAEHLDEWTDIAWCPADYWYIQKCAVAVNAYGRAGWAKE